jgi:branched-subunit amino acid aminotransferase/4-amino-4-deoxychorismate lyase
MRLLVWNDGQVVEASQFSPDRPFVMQRIHTLNHKVYHLSRHIEQMREASMMLFGFASLCGVADAERIIVKLLELSRVSPRLTCPVVMRLDCYGALSFEVEMPSFDSGMAVRAKRISGAAIPMSAPNLAYQSSMSIAVDEMAKAVAEKRGGGMPIWINHEDNVVSLPWSPIFVVYNGRVYTPQQFDTVEFIIAKRAIESLNLELVVRDIPYSSLLRVDEIFFVDTISVSSLSSVEKHRLLSVVTTRITSRMEPTISGSISL